MYPEWTEEVYREAYRDAINGGASKFEAREYAEEQVDMELAHHSEGCDFYVDEYYNAIL